MSPRYDSGTSRIDREALLERVLDEVAQRVRDEEAVTLEEYVDRYPDLAIQLRELLPSLLLLEGAAEESTTAASEIQSFSIAAGSVLGDYRLLRELGRGGMGVVWEADQLSLGRVVALKLLPPVSSASGALGRRFELEAQAVARLEHAHIIEVFEIGEAEGIAFYAMRRVDGVGLDRVIAALHNRPDRGSSEAEKAGESSRELAQRLRAGAADGESSKVPAPAVRSLSEEREAAGASRPMTDSSPRFYESVARLGACVADALAHAHAEGILHRDIKPSNLLLDRSCKIWVADFGLAKLLDAEDLTQSGDAVGTLRYMGPERLNGWSDPRSDVYSLGATLYELVSGRPPHDSTDRPSLVRRILSEEVARLRTVDSRAPQDLETILSKALSREPGDRYDGASAMRDDLQRFADKRPIAARRVSALERARFFARRNPILTLLGGAIVVLAAVASISAVRLGHRTRELTDERARTLENLWMARLERARASRDDSNPTSLTPLLESIREAAEYRPSLELRNQAIRALSRMRLEPVAEFEYDDTTAISPDGSELIVATGDKLRFVNSASLDARLEIPFHPVWSIVYSADGRHVRTRGNHGGPLTVCRVSDGKVVFRSPQTHASCVFHPDTRSFLVVDGGRGVSYDLETGDETVISESWHGVSSIDVATDGTRAVLVRRDRAEVIDLTTGRVLRWTERPDLRQAAWRPHSSVVALAARRTLLWNTSRDEIENELDTAPDLLLDFSPDGSLLTATSSEGPTEIWDAESGQLLARTEGMHRGFRSDSRAIFLREGRQMSVLRIDRSKSHVPFGAPRRYQDIGIHPDGHWLSATSDDGVSVWRIGDGHLLAQLPTYRARTAAWRPDGSGLLTSSEEDGLLLWPLHTSSSSENPDARLGPPEVLDSRGVWGLRFSADGRWRSTHNGDEFTITAVGEKAPRLRMPYDGIGNYAAVANDGKTIATGNWHGEDVRIYDLETRSRLQRFDAGGRAWVEFARDGRLLVGTENGLSVLAERGAAGITETAEPWELVHRSEKTPSEWGLVHCSISPVDDVIACAWTRHKIRLLDSNARFEPLCELDAGGPIAEIYLDRQGSFVAAILQSRSSVRLWRIAELRSELRALGLDWRALPMSPSATNFPEPALEVELGWLEPSRQLERARRELAEKPESSTRRALWRNLATAHGEWGDLIVEAESGYKSDPSPANAAALAWFLTIAEGEHADPSRAVELAREALDEARKLYVLRRVGGIASRSQRHEAKAAKRLALSLSHTLGVALLRQGKFGESIECLEACRESETSSHAALDWYPLAEAYLRSGDRVRSLSFFELALRSVEDSAVEWDKRTRPGSPRVWRAWTRALKSELRLLHESCAEAIAHERPMPPALIDRTKNSRRG